jgi:hypothetical protein
MPYYQGDYYQGDYYQGDPGLFGLLKKGIGGALRVGAGLLTGGPLGAAKAAVNVARTNTQAMTLAADTAMITPAQDLERQRLLHAEAIAKHAAMSGGAGAIPMLMQPGGSYGMMRGMRPNKSTYVTRGGGTSRWAPGLLVHPKGTELVKSRRMNVANVRALRRGLRRAQGFAKIARRVLVAVHHFKKGGKKKK